MSSIEHNSSFRDETVELDVHQDGGGENNNLDFESILSRREKLKTQLGVHRSRNEGKSKYEWEASNELEDEIVKEINDLSESELDAVYEHALTRIRKETNYFKDEEEMKIADNIANYDLGSKKPFGHKKVGGVRIHWDTRVLPPPGGGSYDDFLGIKEARIRKDKPTKKEIIESLAVMGILPKSLKTMIHEIVHSHQFSDSIVKSFFNRMSGRGPSSEMKESHAYHSGTGDLNRSRKDIVDRIKSAKTRSGKRPLYSRQNTDELIEWTTKVDYLRALGYSPIEIGGMLQKDASPQGRGVVDKLIQEQLTKHGWDEIDLENQVMADRLKKEIDQLDAMKIAREEIQKVTLQRKILLS